MILIYEPKDGEPERYDLDELSSLESEEIERVTDQDWDEIETDLKSQKPGVMRAALWVIRKRITTELRYSEFDVPGWRQRLRVRLTAQEVADHVDAVNQQLPDEDSGERAYMLRLLAKVADDPADVEMALAPAGSGKGAPASAAKGRSRRSASATSGPSPTT